MLHHFQTDEHRLSSRDELARGVSHSARNCERYRPWGLVNRGVGVMRMLTWGSQLDVLIKYGQGPRAKDGKRVQLLMHDDTW